MSSTNTKISPPKKRSLLVAETESERFLARIRFTIASLVAAFSLYLFATNKINFQVSSIQIGLLILASMYNAMFLFDSRKHPYGRYVVFFSAFFDVIIMTIYIWTFYLAGFTPEKIHIYFFPVYFIVVGFTAIHNQGLLSVFTGLSSVIAYSILSAAVFETGPRGIAGTLWEYAPGMIMLLVAASISAMISRNNFKSVEKISASEGRFSTLGNALPLMLFKTDKRGKITWARTMSNRQFGIASDKIIGHNIRDFLDDPGIIVFDDVPVQGTFKVRNFNSSMKFVDLIIRMDSDDNSVYTGSMVDVTDRELAISQREEMEQRLFQYKKMESLGTLASGMAHDFNNILQTVTDITERVSIDTKESKTKLDMGLITETLSDARFLISELLALGRKKPLDYCPMDVNQFLRDVVPLYNDQLGDSYEVNLTVCEEPLWIQGDTDYLKRICQNLFGNARDAMPEGGIISVEGFLTKTEENDNTVVIRFSDTGIGIPEDIAEKIFDPFYTTKKKGKGTGLGLALVRRIVSLHKGVVFVEKSDSHGTTFRIEIPECTETNSNVDTKAVLVNRISTTILILDDDPKMCNILNFFLSELSYKPFKASTLEEGLRILQENISECQILIMDWKLGENNPHDVITRFRSLKPNLIIIVISGYQPQPASIKKMNIFRWLTKPYDKNRLDLEIQKALYLAKKETNERS